MHDGSYGTASAHSDGGLCVAIRDGSAGAAELVSFPDGTKGAAAALNVGACWSCFCFLRLTKFFLPLCRSSFILVAWGWGVSGCCVCCSGCVWGGCWCCCWGWIWVFDCVWVFRCFWLCVNRLLLVRLSSSICLSRSVWVAVGAVGCSSCGLVSAGGGSICFAFTMVVMDLVAVVVLTDFGVLGLALSFAAATSASQSIRIGSSLPNRSL